MNRVLVVDDEPDLEALILQKFRREAREGRVVFSFARDGLEALERLAEAPETVLVLADINMPRMDGLALLAQLQGMADPPATVIVSAYGDMANIRTAMNRGAFDFLTKPVDLADLETTVVKTLRHVTERRAAEARRIAAERAHATLARYFSPNLARELADAAHTRDLGSTWRDLTAVFTDISGFTALVETLDAATLAAIINAYLSEMTDIVFAHGGTVAKVMGDGMMLLFGAPTGLPDHAARAVACALALDAFSEAFRAGRATEGIGLGPTRIGVHSGPALVGDFGGGRHFDYTAYGETINLAARLEVVNRTIGTRVLVSATTADRIADFQGRMVGALLLRGTRKPLQAFEPLTPDRAEAPDTIAYAEAFARLGVADADAAAAMARLAAAGDALAAFHASRLAAGGSGEVIELR